MTTHEARALIRYALAGLVLTVAIAWGLYLSRSALLLIYISALVAIGLAPLAAARTPSARSSPRSGGSAWRYSSVLFEELVPEATRE